MGIIDMILIIVISIVLAMGYIEYQKRKNIVDAYKDANGPIEYDNKFEEIYYQMEKVIDKKELEFYQSKIKKYVYIIAICISIASIVMYVLSNFTNSMNSIIVYIIIGLLVIILIGAYLSFKSLQEVKDKYISKYKGIIYYEFEKILGSKTQDNEKQIETLKRAYMESEFDNKINNLQIYQYIQTNINGSMMILTDIGVYKKNKYIFYKRKDNNVETYDGLFVCATSKKKEDIFLKGSLELLNVKKDEYLGDNIIENQFKQIYTNISNKPVVIDSKVEQILLDLYNRFGILLKLRIRGDLIYIKLDENKILNPSLAIDAISKEQLWNRYVIIRLLEDLVNEL